MKKPVEFPKKNIFEVPDGYFDKLPGVIQARVAEKETSPMFQWSWGVTLKYAMPILILAGAGLFWYQSGQPAGINVKHELAQLEPDQIKAYLDLHDATFDGDATTDDLVDSVRWTRKDVDQLEKSVYTDYGASNQEIQKIWMNMKMNFDNFK